MASRPLRVGPVDKYLAVETPGTQQGRIEDLRPVGGGQMITMPRSVSKPSISASSWFSVCSFSSCPPLSGPMPRALAQGIQLVDEDDAGGVLRGLFEQVAHPCGADADEHLHELRAADGEEGHAGFAGNGPGQQRLAGARRTDQQHAFWDVRTQSAEVLRRLQEIDDFAQLFLGLVDAGDIIEGHSGILLDVDLGLALADTHQAAEPLAFGEAAEQEHPQHKEEQYRKHPGKDLAQQGAFDDAGEFDVVLAQMF